MQHGSLTATQITAFDARQAYIVREPDFLVWIEGFGDLEDYVMGIDTEVALESPKGRNHLQIGRGIITVDNEGGYFYTGGESQIGKHAKMKIWAGFKNLRIPIFTGIVDGVKPRSEDNIVDILCKDYMGVIQDMNIEGNQEPNNTIKLLFEMICDDAGLPAPVVSSTAETTSTLLNPTFDRRTYKSALEEIVRCIFYAAYFDEDGYLQTRERESSTLVNFTFGDRNVLECFELQDTEIINAITVEYEEDFYVKHEDQNSIDTYRTRARTDRTLLLNSNLVSSKYQGATTEALDNSLEGFKFTSDSGAGYIDCIHVKMKKDAATGNITAKIYDDSGGVPNALLGTSQIKASANLSTAFAWEIFYFTNSVEISPSTDYWIIIDTSSVSSGTVYVQISAGTATGKHAYFSGGWQAENDKQILHAVRSSREALRVARDVVRFYRDPHERIRIIAPAVPQLQLLDKVMVDVTLRGFAGHYIIEGRRHVMTPEAYTTIDTLRKAG